MQPIASKKNHILSYDENGNKVWTINMADSDNNNHFVIDRPNNGIRDFVISTEGDIGIRMPPDNPYPEYNLDLRGRQRIMRSGPGSELLQLRASLPEHDNWITSLDEEGNRKWVMNFMDRSRQDQFGIFSEAYGQYVFNISTGGNVGIKKSPSSNYALDVNGGSRTHCLEITGGCDGAEYFNIKST